MIQISLTDTDITGPLKTLTASRETTIFDEALIDLEIMHKEDLIHDIIFELENDWKHLLKNADHNEDYNKS